MQRFSIGNGPRAPLLVVSLGALLLLWSWAPSTAQVPSMDALDAVFADLDGIHSPGCVAAASRDGDLLFERAWGMANLELGVPLAPDSVFYAGSVSKQFTTAAIALLALRGRLDLDDDVRHHFPELGYDKRITVRQLIHHTSGIRDYFVLMGLAGHGDRAYIDNAISLDLIGRQRDLNFPPGERHLYTNSGYMLLAELVPRVDGRTLRQFAAEEIFGPLDMTDSQFEDDYRTIIPGRAASYGYREDGSLHRYVKAFDGVGSGGMMTTARDLLRWVDNFEASRRGEDAPVGGAELAPLMLTRGRLGSGEEIDYAFAIEAGEYRGARTLGHGGALKGFRTDLTWFPDHGVAVAVLCNVADAGPSDRARRIADMLLGDELEPPRDDGEDGEEMADDGEGATEEPSLDLDPERVREYAGDYFSEELAATYRIRLRDGELRLRIGPREHGALVPVAEDELRSRLGLLRFRRDDGAVVGFELDAGRVEGLAFVRR
ncbi:MAG: serine hydrolase domain-containing protein [Acidobacteriota bacterium]